MRTRRVRSRGEFAALRQRGVRSRQRSVRVTVLVGGPEVRMAFAIGRSVGIAVVRNRLRRRLRAAMGELAPPPGTYLLSVAPPAATLPYAELRDELAAGLADVARS